MGQGEKSPEGCQTTITEAAIPVILWGRSGPGASVLDSSSVEGGGRFPLAEVGTEGDLLSTYLDIGSELPAFVFPSIAPPHVLSNTWDEVTLWLVGGSL